MAVKKINAILRVSGSVLKPLRNRKFRVSDSLIRDRAIKVKKSRKVHDWSSNVLGCPLEKLLYRKRCRGDPVIR